MIFHHICYFQLVRQVLAVFANSPFDQGYLTEPPLHIRRTFCDLSPFLSFSPCLSGFRRFFQIVILPWISLGHSIQFPLFGNFLVRSPIFTILVRFWHILPDSLFYQKIFWSLILICVNSLVIFLAKFTIFHPPDRFSPFPPDSSFWSVWPFDQGHLTESRLNFSQSFCDLSPYLLFFNFSVRFWPFLPIHHLTRDISRSLNKISVNLFVIFHHICFFSTFLSGFGRFCQFAIWPGISHWASITYSSNVLWSFTISAILTFPVMFLSDSSFQWFLPIYLLFLTDLPISPFWSGRFAILPEKSFEASFAWEFSSSFSTLFATRIHRRNCIHNMDQVLSSASACLHEVVWIGGMRPNGKPFDKIYLSGIRSEKCRWEWLERF